MVKNRAVLDLHKIAKEIALSTFDISYKAKVGHVGSALSISDILTVLYFATMKLDRDKFILSKGHAAASLYATLYKKKILSAKEFNSFGQNGGLCEHPELGTPGIEMMSGSLGHGLGFAIGTAHAQKIKKTKGRTFVLISDGECDEGSIWEAALLAPNLKLDNLISIIDYNDWQCFGRVRDILNLEPFEDKWRAFGWSVHKVDGHNIEQLAKILNSAPRSKNQPTLIIAKTTSGKGIPLIENRLIGHYKVFDRQEYQISRRHLEKK